MKICIAGKNNIAVNICEYILDHYENVTLYAISNATDDGVNNWQRSFRKFADEHSHIQLTTLEKMYEIDNLIFLSTEFDKIIKPKLFRTKRLYNIHFSKLPAYKGMYTAALPILHGQKQSGVTLHCIDEGIDTGDIIAQKVYNLAEDETAESIYCKNIEYGTSLIINNLDSLINGNYTSTPQPISGSTYFSKHSIDYQHLIVELNGTANQLDSQIRAFHFRPYQLPIVYGYPIVYTHILDSRSSEKCGTVIENTDSYIRLATIDYDMILYKDRLSDLMDACRKNNLDLLKNIENLSYYVNAHEKNNGWTLLMVAAYNNAYEVVEYLLEKNANVNAFNHNGTTPLMYAKDVAIVYDDYRILDLLLVSGADVYLKDYSGRDVFSYVKKQSMKVYNYMFAKLK